MKAGMLRHALGPLLLTLLLTLLPAAPPARATADRAIGLAPGLVADLERTLEAARVTANAPGALLAVAVPGYAIYSGARGLADSATGAPLNPAARVRVASVTKTFVAVVALQLVQEGWLNLEQTVDHWLPGLIANGDQISVRQLLSHTSGLPDYLSDRLVTQARREPTRIWTPQELVAIAMRQPPRFAPGAPSRWAYANTNYLILGLIIERVTGNSLDRELQQRIIEPLGLRDTALAPPSAEPGELAHGYVGTTDYTALNMSVVWAAGALVSTVEDLARFTQALVWGELLQPDMLNLMLTYTGTNGAWGVPDLAYGLGVMRRPLPGSLPAELRLALGHTGALAGYRTVMWYFPASGVTIVAAMTRHEVDPNLVAADALALLAAHGLLAQPAR